MAPGGFGGPLNGPGGGFMHNGPKPPQQDKKKVKPEREEDMWAKGLFAEAKNKIKDRT